MKIRIVVLGMMFVFLPNALLGGEMEFIPISSGTFEMGDSNGSSNEKPLHPVVIGKAFEIQKTEVTQEQWYSVMGDNPSYFKGGEEDRNKLGNNPDHPVENVNWNMVQEFISKLNEKNDGYHYRLPTEAEWEYAARGGTKTAYSFGNEEERLSEYGWYSNNSEKQNHPVARKKTNPFGLYDVHGNVWEWVSDWYGAYPSGRVSDPQGPSSGSYHVIRGGGWFNGSKYLRSAKRVGLTPDGRGSDVGLRVVRVKLFF